MGPGPSKRICFQRADQGKIMAPKIDWSLKKTIIKCDLDLNVHKGPQYDAWKRQVKGLFRASGANEEGISWDDRYTLLESTCEGATFQKIDALRLQLPVGDQENVEKLLDQISTIAAESENIWIHRHKFHEMKQGPDQSLSAFYSDLVNEINMCKFDQDFCDRDKQRVINLMLLFKLVFNSFNSKSRSKLFEEKKLTLEKAVQIIENQEALEKTENIFDGQTRVCTSRSKVPLGNLLLKRRRRRDDESPNLKALRIPRRINVTDVARRRTKRRINAQR